MIDTHCHLSEKIISSNLSENLKEMHENGVDKFIGTAISPYDVEFYLKNNNTDIFWTAGIHPVDAENSLLSLSDIDELAKSGKIIAIGEIGTDLRFPDIENQLETVELQLKIALKHDLPVIIHCVKTHYIILKLLEKYDLTYIFHGFSGSFDFLRRTIKHEKWFYSVNPKFYQTKNQEKKLSLLLNNKKLMLESDAPFAPGCEVNPLTSFLIHKKFLSDEELKDIADTSEKVFPQTVL